LVSWLAVVSSRAAACFMSWAAGVDDVERLGEHRGEIAVLGAQDDPPFLDAFAPERVRQSPAGTPTR
jgi:hypothetical protein